jgi:hypothetical protein
MNRTTGIVVVLVGIAAVAAVLRFTLFADRIPDRVLIQRALMESIEAGKEGRPGSVIELLSREFEVNGYQPGTGQITRMVKEYKPDVEVLNQEPSVTGDRADLVSPVRLTVRVAVASQSFDIKDVRFQFEKEQGTQWLFFPTKHWRLRSVELPADAAQQLSGLGGFGGFGGGLGLFGN